MVGSEIQRENQIKNLLVDGETIITITGKSQDLTTARLGLASDLILIFTSLRLILFSERSAQSIVGSYFLDEIEMRARKEFWNMCIEIRPISGKIRRLIYLRKNSKEIAAAIKQHFTGSEWGGLKKDTISNYDEIKQAYFKEVKEAPARKFLIEGYGDRSVYITDHVVHIIKNVNEISSSREKSIPMDQITSVEVKLPNIHPGFIQFSIAGSLARDSAFSLTGGSFGALIDENSVVFDDNDSYQTALKIKSFIEAYSKPTKEDRQMNNSVADEILKFKSLCDQGIITSEEFNKKKEQLLGL